MCGLVCSAKARVVEGELRIPISIQGHGGAELVGETPVVIHRLELPPVSAIGRTRKNNIQSVPLTSKYRVNGIVTLRIDRETQIRLCFHIRRGIDFASEADAGFSSLLRRAELE